MTRVLICGLLFAIAGAGQERTAGRVPFATTGGVLAESLIFGKVTMWPLSTLVSAKPTSVEYNALMPLVIAYQSHYLTQRMAEAAFEMKGGTKESKRPLQEKFDAAKKLADEAMAKVRLRVEAACDERKWKNCALVVPVDDPAAAELRGEKQ